MNAHLSSAQQVRQRLASRGRADIVCKKSVTSRSLYRDYSLEINSAAKSGDVLGLWRAVSR